MSGPKNSSFEYLDLHCVKTISISERDNLVSIGDFAEPFSSPGISSFLDGLPLTRHRTNSAGILKEILGRMKRARMKGAPIIWACGPHLIKYGLSKLMVDLMDRGFVSAYATNGAGAIHDVEIALFGETSEEMSGEIGMGRFGMARETGEFINRCAARARREGRGLGETLGMTLVEESAPHLDHSILAGAWRHAIPMTIHVAVGTDIVHMHPGFDGADTGAATQHDFQILAAVVKRLSGGLHLNIASSVILPEVFLKCLTVANNLRQGEGLDPVSDFMTANINHESEYRPLMNVVRRPTIGLGQGVELLGRIELMLPLLYALLVSSDSPVDGE